MDYDKLVKTIVNESENLVYISDPETFELAYMNHALLNLLGISDTQYQGKLCYKILQGQEKPCPFCTNKLLDEDGFYTWTHYNEILKRYYSLKDKLVRIDGKLMRMEIGIDITVSEQEHQMLERQLSIEETLVECIHTLSENENMDIAINKLLMIIGEFYQADRAYIFELDYEEETATNSYEWCREGVKPEIDNLQKLPLEAAHFWVDQFKSKGDVYLTSVDEVSKDKDTYELLKVQDIHNLMAAPFWNDERVSGFIGVDNLSRGTEYDKLLKSVAYFVENDIMKRHMLDCFRKMSYQDALTRLGNRNMYMDTVEYLKKQRLDSLGVIFVDINGLKYANDNYGHQYGDKMIQNVAGGLKKIFADCTYRIGGDEFVALYINGSRKGFEERLLALKQFQKDECICDFSMGVNYNDEDINVTEQIGYSDNMMYLEKQVYYGNSKCEHLNHHGALARELVQEIEEGNYEVYLQPKIRLRNGKLSGAEALVRRHNGENIILPDKFIPLLEAEGVIQYLDIFVFENVCRILRDWISRGLKVVPVSVNFSRTSLMGIDIVERMSQIRDIYKVPAGLLIIEVTESLSKMETIVLKQLMKKFHSCGFRLSMDDYGSKYSNLSLLTKLDFSELKIDRSLIQDIVDNPRARVLVQHAVNMCRDLMGIESAAEGIENQEQLEILKAYECETGQGFYFSKALPVQEFLEKYYSGAIK